MTSGAAIAVFALGLFGCSSSFDTSVPDVIDAASPMPDAPPTYIVVRPDDASESVDANVVADANAATDASDETTADVKPACDATKDPKDAPCVIDDAYAIFVAASIEHDDAGDAASFIEEDATARGDADAASEEGTDASADAGAAAGSMANPVTTIGQGLSLAVANGKSRVYICNGTYMEAVSITSGVSLYGGFACSIGPRGPSWRWVGGTAAAAPPSVLNPTSPSYALMISAPTQSVSVEDMTFTANDARGVDPLGNGASSIAAFVNASTVTFSRCTLIAGKGAPGSNGGTLPSNYAEPAPVGGIGLSGGAITCNYAADGVTPDSSTGGAGGILSFVQQGSYEVPGSRGTSYPPVDIGIQPPKDGAGGASGSPGDDGADGPPRGPGMAATNLGQLSSLGWVPSRGGSGGTGAPGQGGGGAGDVAGQCFSAGSGGGAGGCGGSGGAGGGGGGGSIALASVGSAVTLKGSSLISAQGGDGGNGGDGQAGQSGGAGGVSSCGLTAGRGGSGAGGSGGAGGTGGVSLGILYIGGSLPLYSASDTSFAPGLGGGPGLGGMGGMPGGGLGNYGRSGSAGFYDRRAYGPYLLAP